jgi:hypothetical protein
MQIRIARVLNKVLLLFSVVIVLLFAAIFVVGHYRSDYKNYFIGVFVLVSIVLALYFRYIEDYWDKRIIIRMAKEGKIALMNISGGKRLVPLRDSSLKRFWIYELEGELYNIEHEAIKKTFQEKMNKDMDEIPQGTVYVSYDEEKPRQIFIIPNAIISSLPNLMPLVQSYEKDSKITIKYLDAHYNKGIVLKTFQETISDYKKEKAE